nr:uncharacterized protein LOC125637224 isoform X2 [Caretta caretta]
MHAARSCSQARRKVASHGGWCLGTETPEEVPNATLRSQPSVLSPTERLQRISKRPCRSKRTCCMKSCSTPLMKIKKCRSGRRGKGAPAPKPRAADKQHGSPRRLYPGAHSHTGRALPRPSPLQPLSQNSFPCAPMSPPTHFPQHLGSYRHQLPPTPVASPLSPENYDPHPLHSTPITMQYSHPEVQHSLHSTPTRKAEYDRTYANL